MATHEHAEDDQKHVKICGEVSAVTASGQAADASSLLGKDTGLGLGSIPSFAAASELLSAPYSCLVRNTHRRHITLPPMYLSKKRTGIQGELQAELLKFSHKLKGVPLAYDNIRIVGQHGGIYADSGYIHMDIMADFIVFQPKKGQKLLGIVNKLGVGHIGCLVHGCFNASIPRPNLVPVETWRDAGPRIGAELHFEVNALDADNVGVLLIRGRLDRTRVQELLAMSESSESIVTTDQPEPSEKEVNSEPTEGFPVHTPKKKKKKRDKIKEEETEEVVTSSPSCEVDGNTAPEFSEANGNETFERKKKKKKEKHPKVEEEEELSVSPVEVHNSDSSGYISDKSSKKRKCEMHTGDTSSFSEEPEPTKSKKKRKRAIEEFA